MVQSVFTERGFDAELSGDSILYVALAESIEKAVVGLSVDDEEEVIATTARGVTTGSEVNALSEWVQNSYRHVLFNRVREEAARAIMDNYADTGECFVPKRKTKTDVYDELFKLLRKKGYCLKDGAPYYISWRVKIC